MITEEQVRRSLETVLVPAVKRSIVGMNLVREVTTSDKKVNVTLASTGLIPGAQDWIKARAKEAIEKLPEVKEGNESVWHLYVIRVPERDRVVAELNAAGIGAGIHYPTPCHLQGAYSSLGYRAGSFPVAEKAASEILSLPIYPGITAQQQEQVAETLLRSV